MNPHVYFAPTMSKKSFKKKSKTAGTGLRPWQKACANKLRGVRLANLSAPCGSGKTVALEILAAQELHDSHLRQKQLVIAPQRVIGDAFTERRVLTVDGVEYTWAPSLNDFVNYKQASVLRGLRRWLLTESDVLVKTVTDATKLDETIAVTSHQALSIVWRKLTKTQRKQALKKLTVTVDEAHHVAGVFDENGTTPMTKDEQDESNHLGQIIQAAVHAGKTTRVRLATATFYRGDTQPILDKAIASEFSAGTFILSWMQHWEENLEPLGLKSFRIDYRFYKTEPVTATLAQIAKDPEHYYMVFVPASNLAWRKKSSKPLKALLAGLRHEFGDDAVLDLVSQGGVQDANVRRLRADVASIKAGNAPQFRAVVSCAVGLEGMDYTPTDRLINLGVQNSITRAIQVMGRPMRGFKGKTKVEVTNYIPQPCKPTSNVSLEDAIADRTNAILTCLAWDDVTHPIIVKLVSMTPKGKKTTVSTLAAVLGSKYATIVEQALVAVEYLVDKTPAAVAEAVASVLEHAGIAPDKGLVAGLVTAVRRAQLKAHASPAAQKLSNFFDVSLLRKSGYNILKKYKLDTQTIFFGDCTRGELLKAKELIQSLTDDFDQMLDAYEAAQKAGKL